MSETPETSFDVNKIAVELAHKIITDSADTVISKGKNFFKSLNNDVRLKLESSYKNYLACVYERYSKAKSFLIRDESTQLYDFYVPLGISCGDKKSEEASIYNFIQKNPFAVIKGSAGSGKSMMMRHLFLNTIEKQEKIPVFIELRRINDFEGNLIDFINITLTENKFNQDEAFIEKALKAGHFALFLDGFDEIAVLKRKQTVKEIQAITKKYDKNIIIISSRPDDEFSSWNSFDVWTIAPLTLKQALKLIKKVPSKNIDEETRDKFLKDLEKELFEKHKSFLSNPLLLSIMVITYASSGDVPQKISTFYENAYIALFERHDALKGAFKRDRLCDLDILEFKKIFSAFSILTGNSFAKKDIFSIFFQRINLRFPKTDALEYIERAKAISDVPVDFEADDFLQDCIKAVCLLIEDGLEITFAHRSFQEYFTALFISNLGDVDTQKELIHSYFSNFGEETIQLLFEINSSLVEKLLLIPLIEELEKNIEFNGRLSKQNYKKFLYQCFSRLVYHRGNLRTRHRNLTSGAAKVYLFIFNLYSKHNHNLMKLSRESRKFLFSFFNDNNDANDKYKRDLRKSSEIINLLAEDDNWGFSMNNLKFVLELKKNLVEKHKQIQIARKENLLKGLSKKK